MRAELPQRRHQHVTRLRGARQQDAVTGREERPQPRHESLGAILRRYDVDADAVLAEGVRRGGTDGGHTTVAQRGPTEPKGRETTIDHEHAVRRREHDPGERLERGQRGVERLPGGGGPDDDRRRLDHPRAAGLEQLGEALRLRGRACDDDRPAGERA